MSCPSSNEFENGQSLLTLGGPGEGIQTLDLMGM